MNSKAFVFSTVTFFVLAIIVTVIALESERAQSPSVSYISSTDFFLEQLEEDLSRVLQITAYRSLLGLEDYVSSSGLYIQDFEESFLSVIKNGTLNGSSLAVMQNATLRVFEERMQSIASRQGVNLNLTITNVTINHTTPFVLLVTSNVSVQATTRARDTSWDYSTLIPASLNISGLRDPLYTHATQGRFVNTIRASQVPTPYVTSGNDTTRLQELYNSSAYVPDSQAPNFLMRFSGNLSASDFGVASLVHLPSLDAQGVPITPSRSVVDFLYFGTSSTSTNNIVNMPSSFLLDDDHLVFYDAQGSVS